MHIVHVWCVCLVGFKSISQDISYFNMSIKGQYGTSDGTAQPNGSVSVCVCVHGKYGRSRHLHEGLDTSEFGNCH